jgi:hypothetical protein
MKRKAAVELSANFLVVIIIGIVIFSMGIWLAYGMLKNANEIRADINKEQQNQIWGILDSGNPVVAPINSAETQRGKSSAFGIGVRNVEYESNFRIEVGPPAAPDPECDSAALKLLTPRPLRHIKENSEEIFTIGVGVPTNAKRCDYVLNVEIKRCSQADSESPDCEPSETYFLVQKLYITVP